MDGLQSTYHRPSDLRHAQMPRLLTILGMEGQLTNHNDSPYTPKGSWWERHEEELDYLLADIHQTYRRKAKEVHPDRGGNKEQMVLVNLAYAKVRKLFAQRGIT